MPTTRPSLLPPEEGSIFEREDGKILTLVHIRERDGNRLTLAEPLPFDVPAHSRLGYAHNLLDLGAGCTLENVGFEGGRVADIPMPGHQFRNAVWSAHGLDRPPAEGVVIRHCVFRNTYGRGVALYNLKDAVVEGCLFEDIADEALDFDHFCLRGRAIGNEIRRSVWGVVLNDAKDCVVEFNRIEGCGIGIWAWWWHETPPEDVNRGNAVRHNVIRGSEKHAILFDNHVRESAVEMNFTEGPIEIGEPQANRVRDNSELSPESKDGPGARR